MRSSLLLNCIYALSSHVTAEAQTEDKREYVDLEPRQLFGPLNGLGALVGLGIVSGALGSYFSRSGECKCPRSTCGTGPSACECINTAAVQCWVKAGGDCKLSLHTCRNDPNAPATDAKSQYPPCLPNGGSTSALPACSRDSKCAKVDNNCNDWQFRQQGGCIGICIPRNIGLQPRPSPPKQQQPPQSPSGGWNWGSQPNQGGAPPPPPWQQAGPTVVTVPPPQQSGGGPPSYGSCPANVNCPGGNLCTPDPRNKNTFLCIQPNEICGTFQNIACPASKMCVADPRIQCAGAGCSGICL